MARGERGFGGAAFWREGLQDFICFFGIYHLINDGDLMLLLYVLRRLFPSVFELFASLVPIIH